MANHTLINGMKMLVRSQKKICGTTSFNNKMDGKKETSILIAADNDFVVTNSNLVWCNNGESNFVQIGK